MFDPKIVAQWIGRKVTDNTQPDETEAYGPATVMAVDDTHYAPTAWIRYTNASVANDHRVNPHSYRSVDMSDLVDVETDEGGPRWGTKVIKSTELPLSHNPVTDADLKAIVSQLPEGESQAFYLAHIMKGTKGKANPAQVNEWLKYNKIV